MIELGGGEAIQRLWLYIIVVCIDDHLTIRLNVELNNPIWRIYRHGPVWLEGESKDDVGLQVQGFPDYS
jgi:hypothetical protein